jgi:hypothetical protein
LLVVVRREVNSYTAGFDDPQRAIRRLCTEYDEEFSRAIKERGMAGPRPDLEDHDAGTGSRRVAKHLSEIAIQCDECSAFGRAHFEQCLVRRAS